MKESTKVNDQTILLKLSSEDQKAVDESMKGINLGKKDANNGGRAERRKTKKEAKEKILKGGDDDDEMEQDDEEEDDDDDEMEDGMDEDAVGASMMLPESMKVV